jgi:peptide/nickel transport system substrate-binding protein
MKLHLRWQILLAILAFALVLSVLSFQVQTAALCVTRVPAAGGVFAEGVVGAPQYLNPLLSDANPVDRDLVSLVFDGLTQVGQNGRIEPALAEKWTVAEDGRTLQFTLREDVAWQDGEPVTAADVAFTYSLMQQEEFPGSPALKTLWQSVTINVIDEQTIEFVLAEPYAPFLEATTRGILPAHLLEDMSAAELPDHPFNQSPIGTGPWQVEPGQNWTESHRLQLTPNPMTWREGTQIPTLEFRFYPDDESLLAALAAREVQAISQVPPTILPEVAALPEARLFTAVSPRYTSLLFNLSETGSAALQPVEVRQALAYALDRQALLDGVLAGQGVPLEGPYLPSSWAYNPGELTHYVYDPVTATARLDTAGWLLPEGQNVRQNGEQPLNLRLLTLETEPYRSLAAVIAEQWTAVNINTTITTTATTAALREALTAGAFDVALIDVAPTADPDLYDFWSQEALVRGQNYGRWNNRPASEALEAGRQVWAEGERRPYYDTFLRLFDSGLPALTLYQHIHTYALNGEVNEAEVGYLHSPRDRYTTFANWFLLYRDVTISCPVES